MVNYILFKKYCIWIIFALIVGNSALFVFSDTQMPAAQGSMSLENRHANAQINQVFKDNILLTLAYLSGRINDKSQINWDTLHEPFEFKVEMKPDEVFAFHDTIQDKYRGKSIFTTNAHFSADEGFISSGYLYGDGVCHLASLINRTAIQAGLKSNSPVNHDFAVIPDIPSEYGVSIYTSPANKQNSSAQNLYVENNTDKGVILAFKYDGDKIDLSIIK